MQQRPAEGRRSFLFGLASRLLLVAACETSLAAPLGPGKVPAQVPSVSPGLPLPTASFETWRDGFYAQALATGIAPCTLEVAFKGVTPVPQILALDRRQSEYTRTFSDYLKSAASTARIARGRVLLLKYAELLADIQRRYGVPAQRFYLFLGRAQYFGIHIAYRDVRALFGEQESYLPAYTARPARHYRYPIF